MSYDNDWTKRWDPKQGCFVPRRASSCTVDSIVGVLVGACNDALNHLERGQYMQQSDEATLRVMDRLRDALRVHQRMESEKHTNAGLDGQRTKED